MTPWSIGYIIGMLERCCGTYKETHPPLPRRGSRDCMLRPQSNAPKSLFSVTLVCIGKSFRIWGGLKQRRSSSQKSKTQSLFHSFLLFTSLLSYDLDAQGCCFYHVHQLMECCIYHAQHHCNPCPWLGEFTTIFTCKDPTNLNWKRLPRIKSGKVCNDCKEYHRLANCRNRYVRVRTKKGNHQGALIIHYEKRKKVKAFLSSFFCSLLTNLYWKFCNNLYGVADNRLLLCGIPGYTWEW